MKKSFKFKINTVIFRYLKYHFGCMAFYLLRQNKILGMVRNRDRLVYVSFWVTSKYPKCPWFTQSCPTHVTCQLLQFNYCRSDLCIFSQLLH